MQNALIHLSRNNFEEFLPNLFDRTPNDEDFLTIRLGTGDGAPAYTEEISLERTLTKNISLFKLLNIIAVGDIDLTRNWNISQVFKFMAAPLSVSKSGIVELDLHDKAHGPHGLVAGTTGYR